MGCGQGWDGSHFLHKDSSIRVAADLSDHFYQSVDIYWVYAVSSVAQASVTRKCMTLGTMQLFVKYSSEVEKSANTGTALQAILNLGSEVINLHQQHRL